MYSDKFTPHHFKNKDKNKFSKTLIKRVNQYFKQNKISKKGNFRMHLKTIILFASFVVPYLILILIEVPTWTAFLLLTFIGLGYAGIGMSVMHDANHGAYSKRKNVNTTLGYALNFIGANKYNWEIQHNVLHHTYTNIYGLDEDIENGNLFRLSPYSKLKWYHKFQHIYAWFLYSVGTLFWVILKDFTQIARIKRQGLYNKKKDNLSKEVVIMILSKLFYFSYVFAVPLIFTSYSFWGILLAFVYTHLVAGFLLGLTFQLAHIVSDTEYLNKQDNNSINRSWFVHQIYTTANFAKESKILNWYFGGLNFQIEHHLFPGICHVHYHNIAAIVKQTAKEFSLPYNEYKTMGNAIHSHYRILKRFTQLKKA